MSIVSVCQLDRAELSALIGRFGLSIESTPDDRTIPGSFWGVSEAGLIGDRVMVRDDTPVHSMLHEACHYICMSPYRRARLHTDAGGDHAEEDAVCYLQILLAGELPGYSRERLFADMDAWGYSFRLGSARRWFEADAADARAWLVGNGLITAGERVTGCTRSAGDRDAA